MAPGLGRCYSFTTEFHRVSLSFNFCDLIRLNDPLWYSVKLCGIFFIARLKRQSKDTPLPLPLLTLLKTESYHLSIG